MTGVVAGSGRYGGVRTRTLRVRGVGPLILLLHGFTDSAETWTGVLEHLGASGREVLAVDLPGFGQAGSLAPGPMLPQLDAFVAAVVKREAGPGGVALVGNSLGSILAMRAVASDLPVRAVVVSAEPTLGRSRMGRMVGRDRAAWPVRMIERTLPVPRWLHAWAVGTVIRYAAYADPRTADRLVVARFVEQIMSRGGSAWALRTARLIEVESRVGYDLAAVSCPVLVLHGTRDRVIPVGSSLALHAGLPGSELVVRSQWGHCPQLDDPSGVADLVDGFVSRGSGISEVG